MDDNVSPEALLTGHRKLRTPVQVVPFPGRKPVAPLEGHADDDLEADGGGGAWRRDQAVPAGESPRWAGGADDGPIDSSGHRRDIVRNTSYMPRHHKSEVNPFINLTMHLPWYQYLKMVIVGVTILPFRILFTIVNVFFMWCFATLALAGLSEEGREKPFSKWRRALKHPICWCLRFQCALFGFWWISVKGECADKEDAPIIVSNHVSPFEPFYLVSKTQATPVQRIEDSRAPIVGTIQKAMQIMFVDRANPASKKKCLQTIEERSDPASTFPRVLVFPEGTCTNQRALITFKHGPFITGQNIQPVTVRYPRTDGHLDPSYPAVSPSLVALALRVMCQVWNCMEIEYLPVYVPTAEDRDNSTLFAQHVQEYMSRSLGVPATQHAFEDVALQFQAMKMNLNPEDAVVEWSRVRQSLVGLDAGTAKEYLISFFEMDGDKDGRLSLEEFCAPWKRKRDEEAEKQSRAAMFLAEQREEQKQAEHEKQEALAVRATVAYTAPGGGKGGSGRREDDQLGPQGGGVSALEEGRGEGGGQERVPSWSLNRPEEGIHGQGGSHSVPLWPPAAAAARGQGDALAADEGGPPEGARSTTGSGAEPCAAEDEEELEEEMALAAAAAAAAAGLPGLLREEEMERAYEIFCGGEELTFQKILDRHRGARGVDARREGGTVQVHLFDVGGEATETSSAARAGDFHPAASTRPYRESGEEALRQDGGAEGRRGRYARRLLGLRRAERVHPQRVPGHAAQRHLGRGARHRRVRGCCGRGLRRARRRHDGARAHP
ncbi:1-acyl-sn-glycerol-3-phosphate acyltransferase [Ectocarpus siliculosus]|uniref:1-acyl-sn-glycerol-3-phosphate acyltransferase n=1 Tax=Ectocarpus siliculosus TaxID=2880 RepID=D7FLI2_ECTSI|nr:1-acyl-sn-glycerol-3-phosphate acyltransferase [Ectocarpus siliculosus]|eukprot:CBJ25798.1 1-acyl-sn-glycerol-3-phosphate acyltransferase [Ectocarpus siliculosus]